MSEPETLERQITRRVNEFAGRKIPVLARSIEALAALKRREETVNPREISKVVLRDPMLTLLVLVHLQTTRGQRRLEDITTVEHAIMMLGLRRFFTTFEALPAVEVVLKDRPEALSGLMQVIRRAVTASVFAQSWAVLRADIESDEVVVAALLHDMAEMLLWCFAPDSAGAIAGTLRTLPGTRSADAQRQVLGFSLPELQLVLVKLWGLPPLIAELMDDAHAEKSRVRNVSTAVAIARHAAHGWNNPALPDDIANAARLLNLPRPAVLAHVFNAALRAIAEREWYAEGSGHAFLPPLPVPAQPSGDEPATSDAQVFDAACNWLERIARGLPVDGQARKGLVRDTTHAMLTALSAMLDAMSRGLGFGAAILLVADAAGKRLAVRFVAGDEPAAAYLEQDPEAAAAAARALASGTPVTHVGKSVGGRGQGMLALPLVAGGKVTALAVAVHPADLKCLSAENFGRFKELGGRFSAALDGIGGPPFWVRARV